MTISCYKATTTVSASVAQTSVKVIGTNPFRAGLMIYNNGANSCYVNFGQTASGSTCSVIIPTFTTWTWNLPGCIFHGDIFAIRNAGSGTLIVTEFNAGYRS